MLLFGCAVTNEEVFRRIAEPSMRRAATGGDRVVYRAGLSLQSAYNEMLDEAAGIDGLEGVVLIHQDVELADPSLASKLRARLSEPAVAVVGAIGARGVRSAAIFSGTEAFGRARLVVGAVELWLPTAHPWGAHEVDAVDGALLALSPWAVRELQFDERLAADFHGYDADICFQARARGRSVVVEELDIVHHHGGSFVLDRERWLRAMLRWARKWEPATVSSPRGTV